MFHITENTSAARGEEGLSARHNRALRSDLVNSKLPSRLCDSYKGPHVVGSEWGIADPQPFRVTEDFWAGGWSNYIFNTMQNGPQQKETVGRRNNGGIPGEVQSQDHRERLAGAYVGCITVGTEIGGRVNLNLNWPPFSTQVRRETWAEALSGRESTNISRGHGLTALDSDLQRTHPSGPRILWSWVSHSRARNVQTFLARTHPHLHTQKHIYLNRLT